MESILKSIKKLLGVAEGYDIYDMDIIIHINSVLMILNQLGVGPKEGFRIEDDSATWDDFMYGDDRIESVKTYIYLKVRLLFDTPPGSATIESINRLINELEWRITVAADTEEN